MGKDFDDFIFWCYPVLEHAAMLMKTSAFTRLVPKWSHEGTDHRGKAEGTASIPGICLMRDSRGEVL